MVRHTAVGGANVATSELLLLKAVDADVAVGDDVASVGEKDAAADVGQSFLLEVFELFEESGNMNNGSGTDQVGAGRVHQTRRQKV